MGGNIFFGELDDVSLEHLFDSLELLNYRLEKLGIIEINNGMTYFFDGEANNV